MRAKARGGSSCAAGGVCVEGCLFGVQGATRWAALVGQRRTRGPTFPRAYIIFFALPVPFFFHHSPNARSPRSIQIDARRCEN